ncbi:MAG: ABC transporter permease [Desulfomonilaceae bacterium]
MKLQGKRFEWIWGLAPVAVFLILWEVGARLATTPDRFFIPPFSMVLTEFYHLLDKGVLGENLLASLTRVIIGLGAGSAVGVIIGVAMGWSPLMYKALNPIISLFYPIPALAWLPLLMIWIGINDLLPIAIIFICSFFPVVYNTASGIRNVDRSYIRAAQVLGASNLRILLTIAAPLALPSIFTGLRLEAGMSWRVVVAAEMVAIPTGIGALLMKAESLVRIDIIMVCLIVLSLMCLSFEKMFAFLQGRLLQKWRSDALH